jgi:hypothetical protein
VFQDLEGHLHSEINTLSYPQAALFGFCVAFFQGGAATVVCPLFHYFTYSKLHEE